MHEEIMCFYRTNFRNWEQIRSHEIRYLNRLYYAAWEFKLQRFVKPRLNKGFCQFEYRFLNTNCM